MALTITYINEQAPSPKVTVSERLWRTEDGRLVGDGHPDAAFLFCSPGREVSKAEFESFTLDKSVKVNVSEVERGADDGDAGAYAEPQIKATGGGWYELPNGERVKGKRAAEATLAEMGKEVEPAPEADADEGTPEA